MFLLPFKGREQRAHSPGALPCCEQPCSCTALCYPPLSCSTLRRLCKEMRICFSPGPHHLLPVTTRFFLVFKSRTRTSREGRDLAALSPTLTCQVTQVESFTLRQCLFGNNLNFPLFGAQSCVQAKYLFYALNKYTMAMHYTHPY